MRRPFARQGVAGFVARVCFGPERIWCSFQSRFDLRSRCLLVGRERCVPWCHRGGAVRSRDARSDLAMFCRKAGLNQSMAGGQSSGQQNPSPCCPTEVQTRSCCPGKGLRAARLLYPAKRPGNPHGPWTKTTRCASHSRPCTIRLSSQDAEVAAHWAHPNPCALAFRA